MERIIEAYHKDSEDHWVAELSCGHNQHVRHDPPFFPRQWVTSQKGRDTHLGTKLNCKRCDELVQNIAEAVKTLFKNEIKNAQYTAGVSGLCKSGQLEFAIDSIDSIKLDQIIRSIQS